MQVKNVAEIMTRAVITAQPDMRLTQVIKLMLEHNVGAIPVVDVQQNLLGIVTEYDLMNFAFSGNAAETTVAEVMVREVITFTPDADIMALINCCAQRRMHRMPVVKDQKVVGIISRRDILRELDRLYSQY